MHKIVDMINHERDEEIAQESHNIKIGTVFLVQMNVQ